MNKRKGTVQKHTMWYLASMPYDGGCVLEFLLAFDQLFQCSDWEPEVCV